MNYWHLVLLMLAVPAQLLLSNWTAKSAAERDRLTKSMVGSFDVWWRSVASRFQEYTESQKLLEKFLEFFLSTAPGRGQRKSSSTFSGGKNSGQDGEGNEEHEEVWFAGSAEPRHPRPVHVKFRVGQVIKHRRWGYRGIIIGWDETAQAPESWLSVMHPKDKPHWRTQPNYSILVDVRDRSDHQTTYVPEENLNVISSQVQHPEIDQYFESFNGEEYIPREWLQQRYPDG